MDKSTVDKGRRAEDIACRWLKEHGLEILERNWRFHHLEVDVIAKGSLLDAKGRAIASGFNGLQTQRQFIHIVEVRSRSAFLKKSTYSKHEKMSSLVEPQMTVGRSKQEFLISAADAYVRINHISEEVVFDIFSVEFIESGFRTSFFPDAFTPKW